MNQLVALFNAGRHEEAEAHARALVGEAPLSGFAWLILGASLQGQGKDALAALKRAASLLPGDAEARCRLGLALEKHGRLEEAENTYRQAITLNAQHAEAHLCLGRLLKDRGTFGLAEASLLEAFKLLPGSTKATNLLGDLYAAMARRGLESMDRAIQSYRSTLTIDPGDFQANLELKTIYFHQMQFSASEALCRRALEINPDFSEMRHELALTLAHLCDYTDVVKESNRALEARPDHAGIWEQRLYAFSYHPDLSAEEIFKEFVRWGDRFPDPSVDFSSYDRTPGRRLRIGYVSPDFRRNTGRFYFWPLFSNHKRAGFELFAYSNVGTEDSWTQSFKGQFEHWRDIRGVKDEAVANLIREDRIDILVDLCNHMKDERLGVFTLKPAPIQVTWLGSAWTSGLKTIDYVLFDPFLAPEGTLARETILRLPSTFLAYRPPDETADIVPAPCLKNGHITFGYTGRTERLNHRIFRVWGELQKRLPEARLILDFGPFGDPETRAYFREFLARHGMAMDRVVMRNSANIFEGLNDIDILLDSFPHGGGTMLMDAFWMGVPAVTLASRPPLGRLGTTMLMNLGLPEWMVATEAEYVDKACAFASRPEALNELRLGMRERMKASPLMDGPAFARGVENAYRTMYERWIHETAAPGR